MTKKKIAPVDVRTLAEHLRLSRDNVHGQAWWALLDSDNKSVIISQQQSGQERTGKVIIPRRDFARLCRWYMTGKWTR